MICFVPFGFMAFLYILCGIAFVTVIVAGGVAAIMFGFIKVIWDRAMYHLGVSKAGSRRLLAAMGIAGTLWLFFAR